MMYRGGILFLVTLLLIVPAAGDGDDMYFHSDMDYVPVIYITDTGEYTYSLPLIPLVKARRAYDEAEYLNEWDGTDVVILNALDSGDVQYRDGTEAGYAYGGGGGAGYSGNVRNAEVFCTEREPESAIPMGLLQSVMFSVTDLWSSLNNPKYYLVDLGQKPVETMDFSPTNNFASSESRKHYFQLYIPKEKQHLWVDLNWAGREMGYELIIYPPDTVIGPFEDAADGRTDQRIYLDISASPYLTQGMWYYSVSNLNGGYSNFNFTNYY